MAAFGLQASSWPGEQNLDEQYACALSKNIPNIANLGTAYAFTGGLGGSTALTTLLPFDWGSCTHLTSILRSRKGE